MLCAAALHDYGLWALLPLLGGTVLAIHALPASSGRSASGLAALLLVAVAIAATAWEAGFRARTFDRLPGALAALLPPDVERRTALTAELESFFDRLDLADVAPAALPLTGEDDLAFVLWRGSPLARLDALSALVIERPGRPPSSVTSWTELQRDGIDCERRSRVDFASVAPVPYVTEQLSTTTSREGRSM